MNYRDELTAAYQQIEALKGRLRALDSGEASRAQSQQERLQEELTRFKIYARELETKLALLEQENQDLRSPQPRSTEGMLTLHEYNRRRPKILARFEPAGVLCPYCAGIGTQGDPEEIEMVYSMWVIGDEAAGVTCPRCLWSGYKNQS